MLLSSRCAAALAKIGIKKVYFGCHNDRFGGNGSILSVHLDPYTGDVRTGKSITTSSSLSKEGDDFHGNHTAVENYPVPSPVPVPHRGYEVEAGLLKDEAIDLLQRFYTTENRRAPEEKRKRKAE